MLGRLPAWLRREVPDVAAPTGARALTGAIVAIHDGVITGWTEADAVIVRHAGGEIARGRVDVPRPGATTPGFRIPLALDDLGGKLLDGAVRVEADGATLPLDPGLRGWLVTNAFVAHIPRSTAEQQRQVLAAIQAHLVGDNRDYAVAEILEGTPADEMTEAIVPLGLRSLDREAAFGRGGQMFLVRGTNNLLQQYRDAVTDPEVVATADTWLATLRRRHARVTSTGARFLQCIIPEKSSLLNDLFPAPVGDRTAIMRRLEPAIQADAVLAPHYLSGLAVLSDPAVRLDAFQKLDTHLAPIGAFRMAEAIAAKIGAPSFGSVAFGETIRLGGDVGRRLVSPFGRGSMPAPSDPAIYHLGEANIVVEHHKTPTMMGTRLVLRNPVAACGMRVVAFANSFFDIADNPTQISWWLCRLVSEFHFVWSPELDMDYVDRIAPGVVICQTIERFLSRTVRD